MTLIVNGERIEDAVIQREVERLRPDYQRLFKDQTPAQQKAQLFDWSRENVIERVLINQYAKEKVGPIPADEVESALAELEKQYQSQGRSLKELSAHGPEKIKADIEMQLKVQRLLQDVCRHLPEPSQQAVLEFYEKNGEQFKSAEQVRVSHIVKHLNWQTDETAAGNLMKKAQDELRSGAVFEMLVAKYSDCPENGGDLGYITRGQMVEEFEDVVLNLGAGQISDVFRTRFGFHIAKVYDRKPPVKRTLDQAKELIVDELKNQMHRDAVDEFVDRLKSSAKIEQI